MRRNQVKEMVEANNQVRRNVLAGISTLAGGEMDTWREQD
jgi:hypothetical protein